MAKRSMKVPGSTPHSANRIVVTSAGGSAEMSKLAAADGPLLAAAIDAAVVGAAVVGAAAVGAAVGEAVPVEQPARMATTAPASTSRTDNGCFISNPPPIPTACRAAA